MAVSSDYTPLATPNSYSHSPHPQSARKYGGPPPPALPRCMQPPHTLSKPLSSSFLPKTSPIPARLPTGFSPMGSATKSRCFWEVVILISLIWESQEKVVRAENRELPRARCNVMLGETETSHDGGQLNSPRFTDVRTEVQEEPFPRSANEWLSAGTGFSCCPRGKTSLPSQAAQAGQWEDSQAR